MSEKPLVSVLINNYNYGRYLGPAIDSALAQTYSPIEVVVADDGSTDNSREVLARYGERIVAVIKENGGQASAYNAGFRASSGEFICLLDADDLFLPGKVARVVEVFEQNADVAWYFDRVYEFEESTGVRHRAAPNEYQYGKWDVRDATMKGRPPYVPTASSGLSFRREMLATILPMPEMMRITTGSAPDAYIKWIALASAKGWFTAEALTLQRIHDSNCYTGRPSNRKSLSGQLELTTALCLYERWPMLRRLARKVFARGLGKLWTYGGIRSEYRQTMKSFLHSLTLREKMEVSTRVLCWTVVEILRRS